MRDLQTTLVLLRAAQKGQAKYLLTAGAITLLLAAACAYELFQPGNRSFNARHARAALQQVASIAQVQAALRADESQVARWRADLLPLAELDQRASQDVAKRCGADCKNGSADERQLSQGTGLQNLILVTSFFLDEQPDEIEFSAALKQISAIVAADETHVIDESPPLRSRIEAAARERGQTLSAAQLPRLSLIARIRSDTKDPEIRKALSIDSVDRIRSALFTLINYCNWHGLDSCDRVTVGEALKKDIEPRSALGLKAPVLGINVSAVLLMICLPFPLFLLIGMAAAHRCRIPGLRQAAIAEGADEEDMWDLFDAYASPPRSVAWFRQPMLWIGTTGTFLLCIAPAVVTWWSAFLLHRHRWGRGGDEYIYSVFVQSTAGTILTTYVAVLIGAVSVLFLYADPIIFWIGQWIRLRNARRGTTGPWGDPVC